MRSEQHEALIRMGTHRFLRNMLRSMTVVLTIPFVIFFSVWGSLEGKYTTDWVMSPLTIVVGIAFSIITLIVSRIYYKRDVTAIFESFTQPVPTDSQTPLSIRCIDERRRSQFPDKSSCVGEVE